MWTTNKLMEAFKIDLPIIQAPMAGSNDLNMAIAVSEAGGLGSVPCAMLDASTLRETLLSIAEKTSKAINVNFFAHTYTEPDRQSDHKWLMRLLGYYKELNIIPPDHLSCGSIQRFDESICRVIEDLPPTVVSFHFGLPDKKLLKRIKAAGVKIMSTATTPKEAQWLVDQGCDVVIAQGYEAGGHRGMFLTEDIATQMGTLSLVPQISDILDVPVIAAGGIADGRGITAAFALGADGVQIGTAYLFTKEATINETYYETLSNVAGLSTSLTNVFSGRPARCVVNKALEELAPFTADAPEFPLGFSAISPLRTKAEEHGKRDFSAHYCGQSANLCHSMNARELTLKLSHDALRQMKRMSNTIR